MEEGRERHEVAPGLFVFPEEELRGGGGLTQGVVGWGLPTVSQRPEKKTGEGEGRKERNAA